MAGQRLLIVDDHPIVRRGLRTLLERLPWVDLIVEAANVADAVREATLHRVQLVAMDIELGDHEGDGIDAVRRIRQARPDANILMLTMSDERAVVHRAVSAGARGYVLKHTEPSHLISALETVAGGGFVLGPGVGPEVFDVLGAGPLRPPPPFDTLTTRELAMVKRLVAGDINSAIARRLGLAEKTVRNQLSDIYAKIGVADRTQAALKAHEAGIEP